MTSNLKEEHKKTLTKKERCKEGKSFIAHTEKLAKEINGKQEPKSKSNVGWGN